MVMGKADLASRKTTTKVYKLSQDGRSDYKKAQILKVLSSLFPAAIKSANITDSIKSANDSMRTLSGDPSREARTCFLKSVRFCFLSRTSIIVGF